MNENFIDKSGHCYWSPSKLELCNHCPGYPNLKRRTEILNVLPPPEAADRGKTLHAIAEDTLTGRIDFETVKLEPEDKQQAKAAIEWSRDINSRYPEALVQYEVQIELDELGIPAGKYGCRIDHLVVIPGTGCIVADWKFGRKWVTPPEWNLQVQAYVWGVWKKYGGSVEAIVIQPQSPEGRDYMAHVFTEEDFKTIGNKIKAIVEKCKDENAPLVRGIHCEKLFCELRGSVCPEWKRSILEIPDNKNVAAYFETLSPEERGRFKEKIKTILHVAQHCDKVTDVMAIENGVEVEGWEVTNGRNSYVCPNVEKYVDALLPVTESKGLTREDIVVPPVPESTKSKSDLKKILGSSKATSAIIDSLYVTVPGKKILKQKKGF